jgi:hypothetical protein
MVVTRPARKLLVPLSKRLLRPGPLTTTSLTSGAGSAVIFSTCLVAFCTLSMGSRKTERRSSSSGRVSGALASHPAVGPDNVEPRAPKAPKSSKIISSAEIDLGI